MKDQVYMHIFFLNMHLSFNIFVSENYRTIQCDTGLQSAEHSKIKPDDNKLHKQCGVSSLLYTEDRKPQRLLAIYWR